MYVDCNSDTMEVWSRRRRGIGGGRWLLGTDQSRRYVEGFYGGTLQGWEIFGTEESREGSAIVRRCAGFSLSLKTMTSRNRSLAVGVNLGRSRILHESIQFTTDASAFGCNLFACPFLKHHHKSNEFKGTEQTVVILPVNNDVII